ncbi:TetR/AcrR family transcriptional regulator [Salinibacterium hongtaonis]|uniref:TetR/AcrR family transcriptional regulator n=1 Tax=Homoserinimonas hongtaonis TaxID=2079791 RepID=UPI000D369727|nr:TetR/AcrR family transcriptional regulator [Salinibacterium hongtaonis]AWB90317.1 TetR/AcrR family transcriptional regulator [Salinibacterium hongtaonis]
MPQVRSHGKSTKRDAILAAAAELLLANGFDGTSMDAVAAKAQVSKTTVYAHFSDKVKLFHAVMVHASSTLIPSLHDALDLIPNVSNEQRLTVALTEVVRAATAAELIAFFRVLIAEHERRVELHGVLDVARVDSGTPTVVQILSPFIVAVAEERNMKLADADQWSIFLLRLAAPTLQFDILTSDFTPSDDLIRIHVELVVRVFLNGAFPAGQSEATLPAGYDAYPWGPAFER